MLKQRALKKILITSISIIIILMIYIFPNNKEESLNIKSSIEYKDTSIGYIYALNDNDFLVRVDTLLIDSKDIKEKALDIIQKLINNNYLPDNFYNIIPDETKIKDLSFNKDYLKVKFSKEILDIDKKYYNSLVELISYSLFEIKEVKYISIYVENNNINKYIKDVPEKITRDYGINKRYDISTFNNIQKVVTYYINEVDDNKYLVPITSYVNDKKDKIKIIIENLSSNYIYEPNLISLLNSKTELINFEINDDVMMLYFNNNIFMSDGYILQEVVYTIANSVFDNYDVNKVIFNVDGNIVTSYSRKN